MKLSPGTEYGGSTGSLADRSPEATNPPHTHAHTHTVSLSVTAKGTLVRREHGFSTPQLDGTVICLLFLFGP